MRPALADIDIPTEAAVRQSGASSEQFASLVQTVRQTAVTGVTGTVTRDSRANRLTAAGMVAGDRWLEDDTNWEYFFDGVSWLYALGIYTQTAATRGALAVSASDNGALFFETNTLQLWEVQAGAWVKIMEVKGAAGQLTTGVAGGVLTLGLVQMAAVADAAGGATVDAEARTAINALLAKLRARGDLAP